MDDEELEGLLPDPRNKPGDDVEAVEEAPAETPAAEVEVEPEGPARGPDGKFVAKQVEPGHVPISALLDEREKRQALERRLAAIEAARPPAEPPTRDQQLEAALYGQNLRASRRFAEREYGKDAIATVHQWAADRCDADPAFNQQMRTSEDPYEAAMQAWNREQVLATVKPADLDAYRAWQSAQAAVTAAQPQPRAAQPLPRSLATASGTGAAGAPHVPVGAGEAFAAAIKG